MPYFFSYLIPNAFNMKPTMRRAPLGRPFLVCNMAGISTCFIFRMPREKSRIGKPTRQKWKYHGQPGKSNYFNSFKHMSSYKFCQNVKLERTHI